jgi:hypothetical protein
MLPLRELRPIRCSALTWSMTGSILAGHFVSRLIAAVMQPGEACGFGRREAAFAPANRPRAFAQMTVYCTS